MIPPLAAKIGPIVLGAAVAVLLVQQCRKPWSLPGRLFIALMNRTHAAVTLWGLSEVQIPPGARVLDIGCGGGRAIALLAARGHHVDGVDYSAASVASATSANAAFIASGQVTVRQASVSELPFADSSFDLATAVETHYYWPDPRHDFAEILRVLKPGGTLVLIAETYRGQALGFLLLLPMLLLRARYLTLDEHRVLLREAGFAEISIANDARKGWIRAVAKRAWPPEPMSSGPRE